MWVIGNGAPKGGSTWIIQLLNATNLFERVPAYFQEKSWYNSSVAHDKVLEAASKLPASTSVFLSKQHWSNNHADLLELDGVKLVNIIRDIRDVVVSRYHHEVRLNDYDNDISTFVKENAEYYVRGYINYHKYWIDNSRAENQSYLVCSYEQLHDDLYSGAKNLYDFVGMNLDEKQIIMYSEKTLFENYNTGEGKFLRKGKTLSSLEELQDRERDFILQCSVDCGLVEVKRAISKGYSTLEPYLRKTDVGL